VPLGADVPFFVGGENAFVEGIGERLTPIAWAPRHYAVVKPAESVATAGIFSHPDLARDTKPATLEGSLADMNGASSPFGHNDLQPVAEALCPAIAHVADWLKNRYGNARMTGSGSAVFAEVGRGARSGGHARGRRRRRTTCGGVARGHASGGLGPVRLCRSLARHPLRDWAG
jgi:4-diphosphocytidyl-2-C-methyl-D-erythritol kinase